ncbi:LCP family protein [Salsuginibacillus halophilus]|nr:LCP family protein [Salsuginibacillus halophilus]
MNEERLQHRRRERRRRRNRRIFKLFLVFGLFSFLIFGGLLGYGIYQIMDVASDSQEELDRGDSSEMRMEAVDPGSDSISILFLGVDDRDGDLSGRTDALVYATFNRNEGTVKMTSIPRDTLVTIPERGEDKIAHAHAFGGTDLAVETVENFLDVPVDYYMKMNFVAFIEIVDALGGIEIESERAFTEMDSEDNPDAISIEEGEQTLDGEEALAYARMRYDDPEGDIGRGSRHQEIIRAVIAEGASLSSITSFNSVLNSVNDHMTMNMSFRNMLSLHTYAGELDNIESLHLEGNDLYLSNIYYYNVLDESRNEISNTFREHMELDEDDDDEENSS